MPTAHVPAAHAQLQMLSKADLHSLADGLLAPGPRIVDAVMTLPVQVRPVAQGDYSAWRPLWDGYNAFYGRHGETALAENITQTTWQRFFDPSEPLFAVVAEEQGQLVGLAHYLFHRSTTRIEPSCYLSDLFTLHSRRGQGVGRLLIEAVYEQARLAGVKRVYWQTHESNSAGRLLYEKLGSHHGFIVYVRDV